MYVDVLPWDGVPHTIMIDLHVTLTFDHKVKFMYFYKGTIVRTITVLSFHLGLRYLVCWSCITVRRCVAYHNDPHVTLTFDLKVKFMYFYMATIVWEITVFSFDLYLGYLEVDVSPWDGVSRTIMIFMWLWPNLSRRAGWLNELGRWI